MFNHDETAALASLQALAGLTADACRPRKAGAMRIGWAILWILCGIVTLIAAVLASRSKRWLYAGRAAVAQLFIIGGALAHVVNLVTHANYASFADPALFAWVTHTWRTVVPPNHVALIGLLAVFEATAGGLIISGGRRTQFGYLAVIAFYLALWLFGWIETVWCIVMIPVMVLLLLAERHAAAAAPCADAGGQPAAGTSRNAQAHSARPLRGGDSLRAGTGAA